MEMVKLPVIGQSRTAMPSSKSEWEPIMKFWSETLTFRSAWERNGGEVYEITKGSPGQPLADGELSTTTSEHGNSDLEAEVEASRPLAAARAETSRSKSIPGGLKRGFLCRDS